MFVGSAATNPQLLEVITSWLPEVSVSQVVESPLLNFIFNALDNDRSFEAATDCLCAIFRETREVDEYLPAIQILLPRVVALRARIQQAAQDTELLRGVTRIFAEAGEAWVVLIAREPSVSRPLVEAVLECCARDTDKEAIALTFPFWYELKLYLVLERYIEARMQYVDVFSKLVDIMIDHLQYPSPDGNSDGAGDLFDGDREAEEKFRGFRHEMGDVLKDCCEIMGVTDCLTKVLNRIRTWMTSYASQARPGSVPHWQELEAPIFSMRSIGRMVDKDEDIVLPQIIPLIVQIPPHEKLRFATVMVIGRYTEWTSNHPELLEMQFTYIVSSFGTDDKEIIGAAALAMKFFCTDCKHLLTDQVTQLQVFYDQTLDKLMYLSQEELTEGVASVVAVQPTNRIYPLMKMYCDPLMARLMALANQATDDDGKHAVAGLYY
jgi:transportin-3